MLRIVIGKYLALLLVFLVPVIILSTYPLVLSMYGELEMKTVYSTIFAFFLLGASLLAIGIFISTLTESQPFRFPVGRGEYSQRTLPAHTAGKLSVWNF